MFKDKFYIAISTGFYIGKIPFAPGTCGSILAVLIWIISNHYFFSLYQNFGNANFLATINIAIWILAIITTFFIGIKSSSYYCKKYQKKDASEVVIDEICGQWITLLITCLASGVVGCNMRTITKPYLACLVSSFILFRIFDIFKPWIINKIDKNIQGGLGVMSDDIVAGVFAGITFILLKCFLKIF